MKKRAFFIALAVEAAACLLVALTWAESGATGYLEISQFPFALLGLGLRALSLSSTAGNIVAFVLYVAVCALPLAFVTLRLKKRTSRAEDWLLVVMSGFAFYMMYMMINPAYLRLAPGYITEDMGKAVLGGTFYSLLIGWLVLKLMRRADGTGTDALLKVLRLLLAAAAVVVVFSISFAGIVEVKAKLAAIQSGNTDPAVRLGLTNFFVLLRYALTQLPVFMGLLIFLLGMRLCEHLLADRYGEDAVASAKRLAAFSKASVVVMLLSCITLNLLQILFAGSLVWADFLTSLPLDSIILAMASLLLARYFAQSRALAQDNQLFI